MSRVFDEDALVQLIGDAVKQAVQDALVPIARASTVAVEQVSTDEYLAVRTAAAIAKVHEATIRDWISRGSLRAYRAGRHVRLKRSDLDEYLARSPQGKAPPIDMAERAARIVGRSRRT